MEINYIFHLWRVCFLFWLGNFIMGFPLSFFLWVKYKKKIYLNLGQLIGFSLWAVILSWLSYFKLLNLIDYRWVILIFVSLISGGIVFVLRKRYEMMLGLVRSYLISSVSSFFVYVFIVFIFVVPQNVFPPLAPGYKVNEDAIGILYVARVLETGLSNGAMYQSIFYAGYPLGFPVMLFFVSKLIGYDMYSSVYIFNLFLLCLAFFPIRYMLELIFGKRANQGLLGISTLLGMITYLSVQFVNQLSCSQTFLVPFLFSTILVVSRIFARKKIIIADFLLFSLFLAVSVYAYSFTVCLWLLPLAGVLSIGDFLRKKKKLKKTGSLFFFGGLSMVLIFPCFLRSIALFKRALFPVSVRSDGTAGFWGAKGNSAGYAPFLNVFSSWLGADFRYYKDVFVKNSKLFFILLIFMVFMSLVIYRKRIKKGAKWMALFFICFMIPIISSRYILRSPYYYNKTLFYASFIFVSIMSGLILLNAYYKKSFIMLIGTGAVLLVFLSYSYRSLYRYRTLPLGKFLTIEKMLVDLKIMGFDEKIVAVDNEDWLKYFLFDFGSCVTFARTYPCGVSNVKNTTENRFRLSLGNNYLIGSDYKDRVENLDEGEKIYDAVEYALYKF